VVDFRLSPLDLVKSDESEPETEDSDAVIFTPEKALPAIAKVQRGRKHKAFSPSGVLTPTLFAILVSSITFGFLFLRFHRSMKTLQFQ
jgi:hypothetical protein